MKKLPAKTLTAKTLPAACKLALRDWAHEGLLSACAVLALASALVPLLVLLGVRNGVIAAMQEQLLKDPAILTVMPAGSGNGYTLEWINALRQRPEVAFVVPRTRDIASTLELEAVSGQGGHFVPVDLVPTATGDPLLEPYKAVPFDQGLTLTENAARKIGVKAGDDVRARLGRRTPKGKLESHKVVLKVNAVLPLTVEDRDVAFVLLPLLEATEHYRDYLAVPAWGTAGADSQVITDSQSVTDSQAVTDSRRYAGFRLYARTLDDVATLRDELTASGVEVVTRARDIRTVQALDRGLTMVFALVALTVTAGFMASTASSVLAGVRRKDRQLGMVRLLGFSGAEIMLFPLLQALLTGVCGVLAAGLAYVALAYSIDSLFAGSFQGAAVCRLSLVHYGAVLVLVPALAVLSGMGAAQRAARIRPSDVLREV